MSHLYHACFMASRSHSPRLYHSNNVWWCVQVMKLLIMQFSPASHHFLPLRPSAPCSQTPSVKFLPLMCVCVCVWERGRPSVIHIQNNK
jgi:hypothetical protein